MSDSRQGDARSKFSLGRIYTTPGALQMLERWELDAKIYLQRHVQGDWGLLHPDDAAANDRALIEGERLLSSYLIGSQSSCKQMLWIITEADRSVTTLLLPGEY